MWIVPDLCGTAKGGKVIQRVFSVSTTTNNTNVVDAHGRPSHPYVLGEHPVPDLINCCC